MRARDLLPDAGDCLRALDRRLPPARLRGRASLTSSRRDFEMEGAVAAAHVLRAFDLCRRPDVDYRRWLDFGCGPGRLARHLAGAPAVCDIYGVDFDSDAIAWLSAHFRAGQFRTIPSHPPTALENGYFDVACAISFFARFDETDESAWLAELARVLRPGGLLIASTLSENRHSPRPDGTQPRLPPRGSVFVQESGLSSESGTCESRARVESVWGRFFRVRLYEPRGLNGHQDLWVWENAYRCTPPEVPPRLPCRRWA